MRRTGLRVFITLVWLTQVHRLFDASPEALVPALTIRQLGFSGQLHGAEATRLRQANPEWELMGRMFAVLAFSNLALREPQHQARYLSAIDAILTQTVADDAVAFDRFLLPYARRQPFVDSKARSLFTDGELALMLAARQRVAMSPQWQEPLAVRIDRITAQLERSTSFAGESYPNEGWVFCNTIALAATRLSDAVDGRNHQALRLRWLTEARQRLVDARSGLLVSSFTADGQVLDGPEGSSLWLAAHMLQVVDGAFAQDQYLRAQRLLMRALWGFGWAREWPQDRADDIDSGPTIPLLEANAGSSGLALLGAAAFNDQPALRRLIRSLHLAAFPQVEADGGLRFLAGNQLGDAVLLYALVQGPLFASLRKGST
jgi:hypothetical protein